MQNRAAVGLPCLQVDGLASGAEGVRHFAEGLEEIIVVEEKRHK